MGFLLSRVAKHCRWCGKHYYAAQPHGKDGFCCPGHKQAHHRAYGKYVTAKTSNVDITRPNAVTQKKSKKWDCGKCVFKPKGCALWKRQAVTGCNRFLRKKKSK